MVTPKDIATKDFKKVALGYSPEEVDRFLDDIYEDYQKLYREKLERKKAESIAVDLVADTPVPPETVPPIPEEPLQPEETVPERSDNLRNLEYALERALTLAETAAEETKQNAHAQAEQILERAKAEAAQYMVDAKDKVAYWEQEIEKLKSKYELMRTRVKLLLYAEIELLEKNDLLQEKEEE